MESFKKFLPYFLVAVVFAVGGYFVGVGGMSSQEAAFYKSAPVANEASWNCIRNPQGPGCDNAMTGVTHDPIGGCIGGRGVTGDPCNMMVVNITNAQLVAVPPLGVGDTELVLGNPTVNPQGLTFRQYCFFTGGSFSAGWEGGQWVRTCSYALGVNGTASSMMRVTSSSPTSKVFSTQKTTTSVK